MKKMIMGMLVASTCLMAQSSYSNALEMLDKGKPEMASATFLQLAKSGDVDAQTMLGEMYLDGIGVKVDHQKAFFWLAKAANKGDSEACYLLGFMYENGLQVGQSLSRAVSWYKKAALKGDTMAQFNLAMIYKEGKGGIQKNMKEALKWLQLVEKEHENITHVATK